MIITTSWCWPFETVRWTKRLLIVYRRDSCSWTRPTIWIERIGRSRIYWKVFVQDMISRLQRMAKSSFEKSEAKVNVNRSPPSNVCRLSFIIFVVIVQFQTFQFIVAPFLFTATICIYDIFLQLIILFYFFLLLLVGFTKTKIRQCFIVTCWWRLLK
jgi:hypothetical protein